MTYLNRIISIFGEKQSYTENIGARLLGLKGDEFNSDALSNLVAAFFTILLLLCMKNMKKADNHL